MGRLSVLPFSSGTASAPWPGLALISLDLPAKLTLLRPLPGFNPQDTAGRDIRPWSAGMGNFEMGTSELPQTFNILI